VVTLKKGIFLFIKGTYRPLNPVFIFFFLNAKRKKRNKKKKNYNPEGRHSQGLCPRTPVFVRCGNIKTGVKDNVFLLYQKNEGR